MTSPFINTGLRQIHAQTVPICTTQQGPKRSVPMGTHQLWSQKAVCQNKIFIQRVCKKILFLGRGVDPTLLCPISDIASQSATPTDETFKHI